jgi:uncharacterized alkaline shock family protein YloU
MEVSRPVNDLPPGDPASRSLLGEAALPCGADTDLLLEQAADGHGAERDAHQQQCVHCQAALRELTALWAPVADLASRPVRVPSGLAASVMHQIHSLFRGIWYTLETSENGAIRIAARTVAALARDCARTVPGVRVAFGRSTQGDIAARAEKATLGHRNPHAAVGVLGRTAVVDLAVAVTDHRPVHEVARDIQRHVTAALRNQAGLQRVQVNVTVDDILSDDDAT